MFDLCVCEETLPAVTVHDLPTVEQMAWAAVARTPGHTVHCTAQEMRRQGCGEDVARAAIWYLIDRGALSIDKHWRLSVGARGEGLGG